MKKKMVVRRWIVAGVLLGSWILVGLDARAQPFEVDALNYLYKHDVVYNKPFYEGFEGIPLGNGDVGGMLWCTPSGIKLQINKSDAFDKSTAESNGAVLRSCAQLEIDFRAPAVDWLYLDDFAGRLSLTDATAVVESSTPFLKTQIRAFVAAERNVWIIECEKAEVDGTLGNAPVQVTLDRWGSRTFPGWYGGYSKEAAAGLGRATADVADSVIYLVERFSETDIAVACKVIGPAAQAQTNSKRSVSLATGGFDKGKFFVVIAVASANDHADPLAHCLRSVREVGIDDVNAMRETHTGWWNAFWDRSFVHLPDDYIENIYYLKRYFLAASSRGHYPALFNGSLFTWNRDIRNWVVPHHWNMQQFYWGILPGGDSDLLRPYLDAYERLVPQATAHAAKRGAPDAILWSEGHTYDGIMQFWNRPDMVNNYTPAAQIAKFFWDYSRFTQDPDFLRQQVYPFMKKAAEFYLHKLTWDDTAAEFKLYPTQPYESPETNDLANSITDLGMIRFLFEKCISASSELRVDKDKRAQWQHVLDHLWEAPMDSVHGVGEVYRLAYTPDGSVYPGPTDNGSWLAHFSANTSLVFPAGVVGLKDRGTRAYDAAARIIEHHPDEKNAINPNAIVAARLGMGDQAIRIVNNTIRRLQHFPNGLFYNLDHWHLLSVYLDSLKNPSLSAQRDYIHDARSKYVNQGGKSGLPAKPFIQCGLEPIGLVGAALNEMLLQSHESAMRIFPAIPQSWNGKPIAFTLHGEGGFRLSAYRDSTDRIAPVSVFSGAGGRFSLVNPWNAGEVTVMRSGGARVPVRQADGIIAFDTEKGETYVVGPRTLVSDRAAPAVVFSATRNESPKVFHEAMLGSKRDF